MANDKKLDQRTIKCKEEYEGKHYFTGNGQREFVIIEYNSSTDVIIEFIESGMRMKTFMNSIVKGLPDPFEKSCVYFDDKQKQYNGSYFRTNQGYVVQIIEYIGVSNVRIRFVDSGYEMCVTMQNLRKGQVRNPFHPNKFGGYIGVGQYNGDEYDWLYRIWYDMLIRANDSEYYNNYHKYQSGVYNNAVIVKEWFNFNIFADWYMTEISKLNPSYSYDIDKDLLYPYYKDQTLGKKFYGPNTCVLIPHEMNNTLILNKSPKSFSRESDFEYYKKTRENKIKTLAKEFYANNAISEIAYNALMNYTINLSDLRSPQQMDIINKIKKNNNIK